MEDLELKKQAIEIIIQGAKEVGVELKESDFDLGNKIWKKDLEFAVNNKIPHNCLFYLGNWDRFNQVFIWNDIYIKLGENYASKTKEIKQTEAIEPKHYELKVTNAKGESIECDFFDIFEALNLPNRLSHALKYFRTKGDNDKKINDLEKAKFCIKREIDRLKQI